MRWSELKQIRSFSDLRKHYRRDMGLRLLALLLSISLWIFVNAGQRSLPIVLPAPISYRSLPAGLIITNDPPASVSVEITGPRTLLSLLTSEQLAVRLDLKGIGTGSTEFKITPAMFDVPRQTTVTRISPSQISLDIDRLVRREIPIHLDVRGRPAPGYRVTSVEVEPPAIVLTGPSKIVTPLERAETEPLDLKGATDNVGGPVRVANPAALVTLGRAEVNANVAIAEVITDREFKAVDVAVHDIETKYSLRDKQAAVTLRGPEARLLKLDLNGMLYVDAKGLAPGWHELPLKVDLPDGLQLVRQSPPKVRLRVYRDKLPAATDGKPS
ncbi:MAG: CdaR family protein [Candidatus Binataceae bacterium]